MQLALRTASPTASCIAPRVQKHTPPRRSFQTPTAHTTKRCKTRKFTSENEKILKSQYDYFVNE